MRKLQANLVARCWIFLGALLLVSGSSRLHAQAPGSHPGYLHAIRDLREARQLLETRFGEPKHIQAAGATIPKIDQAISELKNASRLDEKDLGAVPQYKDLPPEGRFHKVDTLLQSAMTHLSPPESDPVARPFKDRALQHISEARGAIASCL